jgi:predicted secreted hydrolase
MRINWIALLLFLTTASVCAQDYKAALPGYRFEFPRDYFNHENYQTEWWYYTGNLKTADDHRFGFELTFFRQGISRASSSCPWFVHDLWMAHMALSDINGQNFDEEERLNRAGPGIAGADAQTGMVWNGNWQAHIAEREEELRGVGEKFGFGLRLVPVKPPVSEGQNGVSQKAEGTEHASHYFSLTRLATSGAIDLDGKTYQVEGTSWMDHEFFSGPMATNEIGWDWLSVQFEDGAEIMLYRMRLKDGNPRIESIGPYSSGRYVDAQGKSQFLSVKDFVMTPDAKTWTSPVTQAHYPVRWHVSIPRLKMEFDLTTPLTNQELVGEFGPSYWEGAIDVSGSHDHSALRGVGYLEMTGYAEAGKPVVPR